jgi:gluconokinase
MPDFGRRTDRWISLSDYIQLKLCGDETTKNFSWIGYRNIRPRELCRTTELLRFLKLISDRSCHRSHQATSNSRPNSKKRWPKLADAKWLPSIGDGAANNIGSGCLQQESGRL